MTEAAWQALRAGCVGDDAPAQLAELAQTLVLGACEEGDAAKLQRLIDLEVPFASVDAAQRAAAAVAAEDSDESEESGQLPTGLGLGVLHRAAMEGRADVAAVLVKGGFAVDAPTATPVRLLPRRAAPRRTHSVVKKPALCTMALETTKPE